MARRVFYSFHYVPDNWRVSQVRNIGAIEDNKPAKDVRADPNLSHCADPVLSQGW